MNSTSERPVTDTACLLALLDCDRLLSTEEAALQRVLDERDALAQRVAELEGTEPEMQYRATGLRVTVGITEEDLLEDGWDGWTLEQRAVRPGPWMPVDVTKVGAR